MFQPLWNYISQSCYSCALSKWIGDTSPWVIQRLRPIPQVYTIWIWVTEEDKPFPQKVLTQKWPLLSVLSFPSLDLGMCLHIIARKSGQYSLKKTIYNCKYQLSSLPYDGNGKRHSKVEKKCVQMKAEIIAQEGNKSMVSVRMLMGGCWLRKFWELRRYHRRCYCTERRRTSEPGL